MQRHGVTLIFFIYIFLFLHITCFIILLHKSKNSPTNIIRKQKEGEKIDK